MDIDDNMKTGFKAEARLSFRVSAQGRFQLQTCTLEPKGFLPLPPPRCSFSHKSSAEP